MLYQTSILALAALVVARPTIRQAEYGPPIRLLMVAGGANRSITAIPNGDEGSLNLIAIIGQESLGTPAFVSGASPNATVAFNIEDNNDPYVSESGIYQILIPDLGETYGAVDAVVASNQYTYSSFTAGDEIFPQLTSAAQSWFACEDNTKEESNYILKWGVFNADGSPPSGCEETTVYSLEVSS